MISVQDSSKQLQGAKAVSFAEELGRRTADEENSSNLNLLKESVVSGKHARSDRS